jgi:hypothetical protein
LWAKQKRGVYPTPIVATPVLVGPAVDAFSGDPMRKEWPAMNDGFDGNMDPECVRLCRAMNGLPGIKTIESCCGHGEKPFRIWFMADKLESLPRLLYWFDSCHSGCDWPVEVIAGYIETNDLAG